jgi:hypothetical protein
MKKKARESIMARMVNRSKMGNSRSKEPRTKSSLPWNPSNLVLKPVR